MSLTRDELGRGNNMKNNEKKEEKKLEKNIKYIYYLKSKKIKIYQFNFIFMTKGK